MLRPNGEIHVSHKTGGPFKKWNLEELVNKCSVFLVEQAIFTMEDYPGYKNKRGEGKQCDQAFPLGKCRIFKFQIRNLNRSLNFGKPVIKAPVLHVDSATFVPPQICVPAPKPVPSLINDCYNQNYGRMNPVKFAPKLQST